MPSRGWSLCAGRAPCEIGNTQLPPALTSPTWRIPVPRPLPAAEMDMAREKSQSRTLRLTITIAGKARI